MNYLIIANEYSGTDKGRKVLAEVEAYLADKQISFTTWKTAYPGHASVLAAEGIAQEFQHFLVIGGDGTFNEVINGLNILSETNPVTLAFIPAGSGNDFVRNTAMKGSTKEILDYIFSHEPTLVDCCLVNGGRFLNVCGFGLDVELALRQKKIKKYIRGSMSYYLATLITICNLRFQKIKYRIDDADEIEDEIFLFAVGNGRSYGGGFPVTPKADLQDGLLDVCVVSKLPFYKVPSILMKLMKGKHIECTKYVRYYKCKQVVMDSTDHNLPLNIDGELVQHAPMECSILPRCIKVYL